MEVRDDSTLLVGTVDASVWEPVFPRRSELRRLPQKRTPSIVTDWQLSKRSKNGTEPNLIARPILLT
jgi:hypothetical protein